MADFPKRYQRLTRGHVRYIWDTANGQVYMLDDGGDYRLTTSTFDSLHKQGFVEDDGWTDEFPGRIGLPLAMAP